MESLMEKLRVSKKEAEKLGIIEDFESIKLGSGCDKTAYREHYSEHDKYSVYSEQHRNYSDHVAYSEGHPYWKGGNSGEEKCRYSALLGV